MNGFKTKYRNLFVNRQEVRRSELADTESLPILRGYSVDYESTELRVMMG